MYLCMYMYIYIYTHTYTCKYVNLAIQSDSLSPYRQPIPKPLDLIKRKQNTTNLSAKLKDTKVPEVIYETSCAYSTIQYSTIQYSTIQV